MPEIYAYMTNFTKGWLKYQNSYKDLTKLTSTWISRVAQGYGSHRGFSLKGFTGTGTVIRLCTRWNTVHPWPRYTVCGGVVVHIGKIRCCGSALEFLGGKVVWFPKIQGVAVPLTTWVAKSYNFQKYKATKGDLSSSSSSIYWYKPAGTKCTAVFVKPWCLTVRYIPIPAKGTVYTGKGTVVSFPTHGLPVNNPSYTILCSIIDGPE